jgi:hypothetical protein
MRLSLLVLIVTSSALAGPALKAEMSDELYFPVQVGAKWVMDAKLKSNQPGWTDTVTKVDSKDGKFTVTVEREEGKRKSEIVYEVSKDELYRKTAGGKVLAQGVLLLKLPYKEGTTWTAEETGPFGPRGPAAKVTHTVGKEEELELPGRQVQGGPAGVRGGGGQADSQGGALVREGRRAGQDGDARRHHRTEGVHPW